MKNFSFVLLFLCLLVFGCGQPGPLYLPTDKPPVKVGTDAEPETKETKEKPQTPPSPANNQPAKEQ